MGELPADQATAVRMRYIEGLGVDEGAVRMGRTEPAFLMLCNRGLKVLRAELRSVSRFR